MAIKKLQNNFTTPEQSKRLLELGVPEWTSDCLIKNNSEEDGPTIRVKEPYTAYYFAKNSYIPCWSVGRLIEIIRICATDFDVCKNLIETLIIPTTDNVDVLVSLMTADEFKSDLDFSKLED